MAFRNEREVCTPLTHFGELRDVSRGGGVPHGGCARYIAAGDQASPMAPLLSSVSGESSTLGAQSTIVLLNWCIHAFCAMGESALVPSGKIQRALSVPKRSLRCAGGRSYDAGLSGWALGDGPSIMRDSAFPLPGIFRPRFSSGDRLVLPYHCQWQQCR